MQKFNLYIIASGITEKSEKVKCATFLHVAGEDAINLFNFDSDVDDLDVLKERFRMCCEPRKKFDIPEAYLFLREYKDRVN